MDAVRWLRFVPPTKENHIPLAHDHLYGVSQDDPTNSHQKASSFRNNDNKPGRRDFIDDILASLDNGSLDQVVTEQPVGAAATVTETVRETVTVGGGVAGAVDGAQGAATVTVTVTEAAAAAASAPANSGGDAVYV